MKTAAEIMDRSFFYASPSDSIGVVLHQMAERGLGSVPVLDLEGRPLGVATTAEIEGCYDMEELIDRLRRCAVCMDENTPIDIAARTLALHSSSSLVLVNAAGVLDDSAAGLAPEKRLADDSLGDAAREDARRDLQRADAFLEISREA